MPFIFGFLLEFPKVPLHNILTLDTYNWALGIKVQILKVLSVKKLLEIRSDTKNGTFAHCATLQKPVHYTIDVRFLFDLHTEW